jgi:predicted nucleic acid-binding protein
MTFADLAAGDAVFVDANIFTYHYQPHPAWGAACTQLLQQIETGHFSGYTTSHVLGEVCHRLMTLEAHALLGWPMAGIGNRLRTNPMEVKKLGKFRTAIEQVARGHLSILPVTPTDLAAAVALSQQVGLLTNDAVTVAVMQAHGLTKLASHDADFDRVPGITRYAPV